MKFLALIPARYASTRFPGKPLALIDGKPMIRHVYERCQAFFGPDCYVATDDERIRAAVEDFAGQVVMTADTHRSGTDRCREALDTIEAQTGQRFDVVVNIQGDEPFIATEHLELIRSCFDHSGTQIATLVKPFGQQEDIFDANKPKVVTDREGFALYFSRSVVPFLREVPQSSWPSAFPFLKHIGLYAYRAATLREITKLAATPLEKAESLEQLRWLENGYRIRTAVTQVESLSVDTPGDLELIHRMR